ncbi:unnamed protein product [Coffea canephora]|uniref:non-specific serine/threonine protein kinase n=1 Tax=Coffea canephora TaxID=49390 RepID=A0A068UUL9_COFCA|nr:unnamed protein product [Coffea canephora]
MDVVQIVYCPNIIKDKIQLTWFFFPFVAVVLQRDGVPKGFASVIFCLVLHIIMVMHTLYQKCKLVHGNLSEYHILYFEGHLHVIDVSQSVDLDHPHALDFLREDCVHVSDFFRKHGAAIMTIRELFDFIVHLSINDDSVDSYLEDVGHECIYDLLLHLVVGSLIQCWTYM